jgi:hypothetical protein
MAGGGMELNHKGKWVSLKDHKALLSENERMRKIGDIMDAVLLQSAVVPLSSNMAVKLSMLWLKAKKAQP